MNPPTTPSNAELELLKCLWRHESCSARELHDAVGPKLEWSYSSTRKTLERMVDKGLVGEGVERGLNIYRARVGKVATLAALSADFARRVLEIDGPLPAQAFADSRLLSEGELEQLESLLRDDAAKDRRA
ncbi:BlaI/MecI/CopY family transcriptional regulator [Stenotrophomonas tumulicola]|uniref:BlaI/MecI/CopY family transcriptional regulator n=1 Tax=Stenotrophomonas tumulicola TaxID=1685415 RepID=A0A7W3FK04_9GAMM|nr:BlaI/MecI/CopY family transcriptional regulator [Stenotrophomonas tumulicola]MBA8680924.1 BlaI/MecI/CopY family transcriptional regulator [Stenotrophomonas tumulicola]